ncbi:hypothetical protein EV181_006461, partial [Coemansia sp. RSA 532]
MPLSTNSPPPVRSRAQSIRDSIASERFFEDDVEVPTGTIGSSSINLANTILGSGMLSMAGAMASLGLVFGSLVILFSACTSGMGLYLLSRCARRTTGRDASFFAVSKLTYPQAAVFFDAAIAIKCFGVSISYLIIFGDLVPEVVKALGVEAQLLLSRGFWITFAIAALAPLAFQRRLDALKYTSFTALMGVVYLFIVVAMFYFNPLRTPLPDGDVVLFRWSKNFFTNLPVFIFAFTCHQNIFSVYNELRDNSSKQVNGAIALSIGSSCGVYQWIAVLGYLTFGSKVAPNLLTMYDNSLCHPARNCLDKVISSAIRAWKKEPEFEAIANDDNDDQPDTLASDAATSAPVVH